MFKGVIVFLGHKTTLQKREALFWDLGKFVSFLFPKQLIKESEVAGACGKGTSGYQGANPSPRYKAAFPNLTV